MFKDTCRVLNFPVYCSSNLIHFFKTTYWPQLMLLQHGTYPKRPIILSVWYYLLDMSGKDLFEVQIKRVCNRNSGFLCSFYDLSCMAAVLQILSFRSLEVGQCRLGPFAAAGGGDYNRTAHALMIETQTLQDFRWSAAVHHGRLHGRGPTP